MLTRIRKRAARAAVALRRAGEPPARERAGGAEARGLHPRLAHERGAPRHQQPRDRAEVFGRRAGHQGDHPRLQTRAGASTREIKELPKFYNGLGISILSTPRGVMSDIEARTANVGGEVLCRVF
jgi:hypothetical protein